jgi:SNF2 family DNA or RNA helicase
MSIDLDLHDQNRLKVTLYDIQYAHQLNILLSGLLTSQLDRLKNHWLLTWHDFLNLKDRMAAIGLTNGRTATDSALKWIKDQEALDAEMQAIKDGKENDFVTDLGFVKTKLFSDQVSGVRFLQVAAKHRRFAVLADEMGIGKTLQLLCPLAIDRAKGLKYYMLVLCPNSVKPGWLKEISDRTKLTAMSLGNGTEQILRDFDTYKKKRTDVLVCHYDGLINHTTKHNKRKMEWGEIVDRMVSIPWDYVACDEAHQIKTLDTKRTKATVQFIREAKTAKKEKIVLYLATGTPISESPLDAYSVLSLGAKEQLPKQYSKFENHFAIKQRKEMNGKQWSETAGYKNLGELKQMLHRVMIRRLKSDIKGMPEKLQEFRYVQMNGAQKALYDDIKKGVYDSFIQDPNDKLSIAFAMTKCIRLRQVLNHPSLVEKEGDSAKHKACDDILEEIMQNPLQKVVIWSEFREGVDLLAERYRQKYGTIKLIGGTSQEELAYWSKNWDTMPERVAIGIPLFGGTGVNFLGRCRYAIYMEPPFSTILFRQSIDRIHRRTGPIVTEIDKIKSSPATIIFLQVEKTIDELVYKILERKGALVDALLIEDERLIELGRAELLEYLK